MREQSSGFGKDSQWSVESLWGEAAKVIKKKEEFQAVYSCQVLQAGEWNQVPLSCWGCENGSANSGQRVVLNSPVFCARSSSAVCWEQYQSEI